MEQEKILILNLLKELSEELSEALQNDSIEMISSLEELGERTPYYVLVQNQFDLPQDERIEDSRILCFSSVDEVSHFLRNKGDVIFNPVFAQSDVGKVLLDRFFSRETVVQMETAYDGILKNSFTTKFSNPLTVGYYSDIIAKYAHQEKADIIGLRTFLSSVASFFTYLAKDKISWFPLDVDYGMTSDAMVVQITSSVSKVYKDYVISSLVEDNPSNPFVGLMEICIKQAHGVDLYYLEKANKLVITGVWLKDQEKLKKGFFPTLLINQLYTYEEQRDARKNAITSKINIESKEVEVDYESIPGDGVAVFEEESFEESKNLLSIKKLVDFIRNYRSTEDDPKPESELQLRDIGRYLRKYPDQKQVRQLEQADREAILKCFKKDSVREELNETVAVVKSSINKEDFLQTVLDNLTEMDEEDAIKIASSKQPSNEIQKVKSSSEEELDTMNLISGDTSEEEMFNKVSGGGNEEDKGNLRLKSLDASSQKDKLKKVDQEENVFKMEKPPIGPSADDIDLGNVREAMRKMNSRGIQESDLVLGNWEVKKKKITEKVTKRLEEIKESGEDSNIESLEEEIMTVFKEEIGNNDIATNVVKNISEDASEKLINEKLFELHESKKRIESEKLEKALVLRDEQISRMKKVLDTIKGENNKLKVQLGETTQEVRSLAAESNSSGFSAEAEKRALENELTTAKKSLDLKEIAIEKLRQNQKTAIENKEKLIDQMQQRIDSILDSKASEGENNLAVEVKNLANENRLLQSQLDVKDRTIENMNRKLESGSDVDNGRANIELLKEKEKNRMALQAMRAFKQEKAQLEGKLRIAQRDARQKETELNIEKAKSLNTTSTSSSKDLIEKEREIQSLKNEQSKMSEQNKALNIRCKQLEQKMRFLNAQVENATKKGGGASTRAGGGKATSGREAKLALKLKQVETAREKMAMDTQRLSSQLDAKKKEAVALTTENNGLKNKIAELEQKLKKAA